MDEREMRERWNELHDYLAGVEDRERAAEKRHTELARITEQGFDRLNKTLERCMRDIADALRASR